MTNPDRLKQLIKSPLFANTTKIVWLMAMLGLIGVRQSPAQHWFWFGLVVVGGVIGVLFVQLDKTWLYPLYQSPTELKGLLSQSLIFLAALTPMALFIVTSTNSPLGIGFVLGFFITTAIDMIYLSTKGDQFNQTYLYQFAKKFEPGQCNQIAFVTTLVAGILSLLAVITI